MSMFRVRRLTTASLTIAAVLPFLAAVPLAQEPAAPGDLWEVVSQMSMEGMSFSMPAQTFKVCAAHTWTQPPGGDDPNRGCTSTNVETDGNTMSWTSTCEDGMTGVGTITRDGDDSYEGEIRYESEDGDIVIKLSGHRIGGCDHPQ